MSIEAKTRPLDWAAAYFDSSGRTGRGAFILKLVSLFVILGAEHILLDGLGFYDGEPPASLALGVASSVLGAILHWPLFIASACILCQRLHDRGWAGWWAAPILLAALSFRPYPYGPPAPSELMIAAWKVKNFIALAILAMATFELALSPGQRLFNRYGPKP